MFPLITRNLFERVLKSRSHVKKYSTKGVSKWGEEISSQIKLEIEQHWKPVVMCSQNSEPANKPKYYTLSMFPYPSGQLHMGHVRVYAISDTISRFHRMNGKAVIHPMGWDAFGLPAENAAFERHVSPQNWTNDNIGKMKSQLIDLGCCFDWEREINTSDPNYYKWTQYLFLELFKAGMVYKKEAFVNWDPVDQTVLADEQVDINGCSWRSGAKVEKKLLNQWFIKTTKFAKQLFDGLEDPLLIDWRDIINLQRHWIGECNGISIDFKLSGCNKNQMITAWTEKPEKLLYASFIAVPLNTTLDNNDLIFSEHETYKVLTVTAENPITKQNLPVIVTDAVVYAEGSGAYLGSSGVDEFDEIFLSNSVIPHSVDTTFKDKSLEEIVELRQQVCEVLQQINVGGYPVSSKLKDWLISRQRYWGTPIPIVYCEACGVKPVAINNLPVILPKINISHKEAKSPLLTEESWINTVCPECGGKATRETDTMDTFVDSSWYFLRYLDSKNKSDAFDRGKIWENFPVDLYIGGKEHAVLHLYYARFMSHFLHSIGKLPEKEPFKRLLVQGMVMGKAFKIKASGKYIPESEIKIINEKKGRAVTICDNEPVEIVWEKMSKSKYNGVDPTKMFEEYGCDTTRLFMLGDVAPTSSRHWSSATFPGVLNWQRRLWLSMREFLNRRNSAIDVNAKNIIINSKEFIKQEETLWESLNYFVAATTFNFNFTYQLSVAISRLQGLTNCLRRVPPDFMPYSKEFEHALACQIIMLAPIAPHFASELWSGLMSAPGRLNCDSKIINWNCNVLEQNWPVVDSNYKLDLFCKVNGENFGALKLFPSEINQLNHHKALDLILNDKISSRIRNKYTASSSFMLYPNCHAILQFVMNHTT